MAASPVSTGPTTAVRDVRPAAPATAGRVPVQPEPVESFPRLQRRLRTVLGHNAPGSTAEHVVVVLPSYSVNPTLMAHYARRLPALEHRYLLVIGMLRRVPGARLVFVSSQAPAPEVVDYYLSLLPVSHGADARRRLSLVSLDDTGPRALADKLLDHPDALDRIRRLVGGRPAVLEPWQVEASEVAVAQALQLPVDGSPPAVRPAATKSAGRRLFREVGVPLPFGVEGVRTTEDVVRAADLVAAARPACRAVVVKHDDSGAGDGNAVLSLQRDVREQVEQLPAWYRADLLDGGVVEELLAGPEAASPSAQLNLLPDHTVELLSTHEQELGGDNGQVYQGCRFPARPEYAAEIGRHAVSVGRALAARGAIGRVGIDFFATRGAGNGGWDVRALEVNLRKGGTTHPFAALRTCAPGHYDGALGRWVSAGGQTRVYRSTDNLLDPAWVGLPPSAVLAAVGSKGLHVDAKDQTGVVLHMLSGLAIDGRIGLTAIGRDAAHADSLLEAARAAVHEAAHLAGQAQRRPAVPGTRPATR